MTRFLYSTSFVFVNYIMCFVFFKSMVFYRDGRISSHSHQRRKDKDYLRAQLLTIIKLCESRCTILTRKKQPTIRTKKTRRRVKRVNEQRDLRHVMTSLSRPLVGCHYDSVRQREAAGGRSAALHSTMTGEDNRTWSNKPAAAAVLTTDRCQSQGYQLHYRSGVQVW